MVDFYFVGKCTNGQWSAFFSQSKCGMVQTGFLFSLHDREPVPCCVLWDEKEHFHAWKLSIPILHSKNIPSLIPKIQESESKKIFKAEWWEHIKEPVFGYGNFLSCTYFLPFLTQSSPIWLSSFFKATIDHCVAIYSKHFSNLI